MLRCSLSDAKIQHQKGKNNSWKGHYNEVDNDYNDWDNEGDNGMR